MTMHYTLTRRSPNLTLPVLQESADPELVVTRRLMAIVERLECLPALSDEQAIQLVRARMALYDVPGFMARLAEGNLAEKIGSTPARKGRAFDPRDAARLVKHFTDNPGTLASQFIHEHDLDERSTSLLVRAMDKAGLIDRPDHQHGKKPITVTPKGAKLLEEYNGQI